MTQFFKLVYADYLQRTRSYTFLITLAVSIYAAYLFVPTADANYTTLRIGKYIGQSSSAWNGYVTAMMASVFLSLTGFYLVNSNIKKDVATGLGMIIAASPLGNFKYLLYKTSSNFMLLFSITMIIALMSAAVFIFRNTGYPFIILDFIIPFLLVTLPMMFIIACFAVVAETFFYRYSILMNIGYYVLFVLLLVPQPGINPLFDILGIKAVSSAMQEMIRHHYNEQNVQISMGFLIGHKEKLKYFRFEGIHWPALYVLSRLCWMTIAASLVYLSSLLFHRFEFKSSLKKAKVKKATSAIMESSTFEAKLKERVEGSKEIKLSALPVIEASYRLLPLIKTEVLMLYRKGPRWLWFLNLGGILALALLPIGPAHQMVLPALWFLQVGRFSDLGTRERTSRIHYFSYASYKPLSRLFTAQIAAGVLLSITLSLPLIGRYLLQMDLLAAFAILMGAILVVVLAVILGITSGSKKLYEITFFLLTYTNLEKAKVLDYFGALNHSPAYLTVLGLLCIVLLGLSYLVKKIEIGRT